MYRFFKVIVTSSSRTKKKKRHHQYLHHLRFSITRLSCQCDCRILHCSSQDFNKAPNSKNCKQMFNSICWPTRTIHPLHSVTKYLQIVEFRKCNAVLVNATRACLQTCVRLAILGTVVSTPFIQPHKHQMIPVSRRDYYSRSTSLLKPAAGTVRHASLSGCARPRRLPGEYLAADADLKGCSRACRGRSLAFRLIAHGPRSLWKYVWTRSDDWQDSQSEE